jgi:hypothetical protein
MPFKSDKQRKWMYANKPEMAKQWSQKETAKQIRKSQKSKTGSGTIGSATSG